MSDVKERCKKSLIKFADMGVISAMSACIKDDIYAEKYLESLAVITEQITEDDFEIAKAVSAAREGYKLADKVYADSDDIGRLK